MKKSIYYNDNDRHAVAAFVKAYMDAQAGGTRD